VLFELRIRLELLTGATRCSTKWGAVWTKKRKNINELRLYLQTDVSVRLHTLNLVNYWDQWERTAADSSPTFPSAAQGVHTRDADGGTLLTGVNKMCETLFLWLTGANCSRLWRTNRGKGALVIFGDQKCTCWKLAGIKTGNPSALLGSIVNGENVKIWPRLKNSKHGFGFPFTLLDKPAIQHHNRCWQDGCIH